MSNPDPPMTRKEHAFLKWLLTFWPGGAGYPLDGPADRQTAEDIRRLIEIGVVERVEETGAVDTGEVTKAAVYKLTRDYVDGLGGTSRPQDN